MALTRQEIMDNTLAQIKKKIPDSVVGRYSEIGKDVDLKRLSTGSLACDLVLNGGFAGICEIIGKTSSGKTTLALTACAKLQRENPDANIMYVDAEIALDPAYARALGVDLDRIILVQPSDGESGFAAAEMFISSGVGDLVVIDSIAAMIPRAILDADLAKPTQVGATARLIGNGVSRINSIAKKNNCHVILINQMKPRVQTNMYAAVGGLGGSWYTPGGEALPFFCSQILEIKRLGFLKDETGATVSSITQMAVKKNKTGVPYRSADFVISYGKGLDRPKELVELGLSLGIISKSGSFYCIPGIYNKNLQGKLKLNNLVEEDPEISAALETAIIEKSASDQVITINAEDVAEDDEDYQKLPSEEIDIEE